MSQDKNSCDKRNSTRKDVSHNLRGSDRSPAIHGIHRGLGPHPMETELQCLTEQLMLEQRLTYEEAMWLAGLIHRDICNHLR